MGLYDLSIHPYVGVAHSIQVIRVVGGGSTAVGCRVIGILAGFKLTWILTQCNDAEVLILQYWSCNTFRILLQWVGDGLQRCLSVVSTAINIWVLHINMCVHVLTSRWYHVAPNSKHPRANPSNLNQFSHSCVFKRIRFGKTQKKWWSKCHSSHAFWPVSLVPR